jgi:hypothetical protein
MNHKGPRPSGWVFARIAVSLIIAFVLGYRWHQGWLTWPLVLMSALIMGLLLVEIFTTDRRREQRDSYPDGRPVPRRRATDYKPTEIDAGDAPEGRVTTSPG